MHECRMYRMGGIVLMVALVFCVVACGLLKFWLWKLNKKAAQKYREQNQGFETFRYVL